MPKISIIGAGSVEFTLRICSDILLTPCLQSSVISLMDIDPLALTHARNLVQAIIVHHKLSARVEASTNRRQCLRSADYVITTFSRGGAEAFAMDLEIPKRYGVEQCVGDTLGPGGVFRALRTIPVLVELCRDMDDVAPNALLLNYVNPMAPNCWAVDAATGRPHAGLCHSVQGTSIMLSSWIKVPYEEVSFLCAGINHQAFFLEFRRGADDLYPLIREAIEGDDIYGREPVRVDLMKHFGFFVTESSGHASEYLPYFRKTARMVDEDLAPLFKNPDDFWFDFGRSGGVLRWYRNRRGSQQNEYEDLISGKKALPTERSAEYCSYILEAMETGDAITINANVPNCDLIDNLPQGCCVEVPCLVDGNGVHPTRIGRLPTQLAALNRTNINVQELVVEAALSGKSEAVYHAVMLDPLTGAACTLPQIRSMVDELMTAEAQWLPPFNDNHLLVN